MVPAGWALCDGTNGTPDLRNLFVRCASPLIAVGSEGGSSSHFHSIVNDTHNHTFGGGVGSFNGGVRNNTTGETSASHVTESANHIPPAYKFAYIMRL